MYIGRFFNPRQVVAFSFRHFVWLALWNGSAVALYHFTHWKWLEFPWLPLSLVGVAVAFYLGFKNNSAYDRMWEARKIWGAIVNTSRSWGALVTGYVSNQFVDSDLTAEQLKEDHRELIYRHVVWLYTLRRQLLKHKPWEHINGRITHHVAKQQIARGVGQFDLESHEKEMEGYLPHAELEGLRPQTRH